MKLIEQGRIPRDESIVVCITGNGYKTLEVVADGVARPVALGRAFKEFETWYAGASIRGDRMTRIAALFDDVLVQKYGGSSVATPERVAAVAGRIGDALKRSAHVVVAVSAMGKTTDQLIAMAREVSPSPRGREMDLLLASGEQIAVSMLGLALQARGIPAVSLTANQCGIHTDGSFNKARVRAVETARLVQELGAGRVVIVAGFQGVTVNDDITTLGRGGGDITGAVLAAALGASSTRTAPTSTASTRPIRASSTDARAHSRI